MGEAGEPASRQRTHGSGMTNDHVAIDGPVASGKTTISQLLAAQTGHLYLDTGAMYRSVAYLALMNGVDLESEPALVAMIAHHTIAIVTDTAQTAGYRVLIDGKDTGERLFDPDVAAAVSSVAARPAIRAELVERQRAIASSGPVVMAGRDIGTVVLPEARFKFFLTASVDERARRRQAEFHDRALDVPFEEVRAQIAERDRLDTTRAVSPLRAASDALTIDSTDLQPEDVVARMRAVMDGARA
ncbi:MAG: (d)CMP kinase [Candidatus Elarobacter sp.]